ncbi:Os11g0516250 [Oryza sativa Japonica Group]|uniref:Os11g0516250 protein n=1 Tax=Oryza sativa subsp. japonica TaxID=39947 RepID=A0A0P0Y2R5_ORYSJ|nr:Os11g0516250 [Oryza sativa Japonica Group]
MSSVTVVALQSPVPLVLAPPSRPALEPDDHVRDMNHIVLSTRYRLAPSTASSRWLTTRRISYIVSGNTLWTMAKAGSPSMSTDRAIDYVEWLCRHEQAGGACCE